MRRAFVRRNHRLEDFNQVNDCENGHEVGYSGYDLRSMSNADVTSPITPVPQPTPPCPRCGYDLSGIVVEGAQQQCPECGWEFTANDLALLGPSNLHGEPRSLKPLESRMRGPWLLAILTLISIAFVAVALYLARQ